MPERPLWDGRSGPGGGGYSASNGAFRLHRLQRVLADAVTRGPALRRV